MLYFGLPAADVPLSLLARGAGPPAVKTLASCDDLIGPGRAPGIDDVTPQHRVLLGFPISHNGDLPRIRRHYGSCGGRSWRGRRRGPHRLRTCPADILLADAAVWTRV